MTKPHPNLFWAIVWTAELKIISLLSFACIALTGQWLAATIISDLVLLVFVVLVSRTATHEWMDYGMRRPELHHLVLAVVMVLPLSCLLLGVARIAVGFLPCSDPIQGLMPPSDAREPPVWLSLLSSGFLASFVEELWFRGFLGRGLISCHGNAAGIACTSILFGLIHVNPCRALEACFVGACWHIFYLASRSLWIPILMHCLQNFWYFLAPATVVEWLHDIAATRPYSFFGAASLAAVAIVGLMFKYRARPSDFANGTLVQGANAPRSPGGEVL